MVCAILVEVWTSGSDGDVIKSFLFLAWCIVCLAKQNGLYNFCRSLDQWLRRGCNQDISIFR